MAERRHPLKYVARVYFHLAINHWCLCRFRQYTACSRLSAGLFQMKWWLA